MKEQYNQSINRRKFVTALGTIGAVASLPLSAFSKPQSKVPEAAIAIMKCKPYLQAVRTDRMTIRWITNVKCVSWVEYGETAEKLDKKVYQVIDGLIQANNTVNDITISSLQAGKTYYYKAISKKIESFDPYKIVYGAIAESAVSSFTTLAATINEVGFVVFNDVHERPETFATMLKYQTPGKKDFILLNGDIFSSLRTNDDQIVKNLLDPVCDLFATQTPFIYSRGNHETRGSFCRHLPEYVNGYEHKFYYSLQLGPMYAIILDTGEASADDNPLYGGILDCDNYRLEQKEWLEKEVQKKEFIKARYKVVINHVPPFYCGDDKLPTELFCRKHWVPILNKAKIDLMIAGHTHVYGVHPAIAGQHNFPIVIGGGPKDGQRTIIDIKVNQRSLAVKMMDDTGKTVGQLNL